MQKWWESSATRHRAHPPNATGSWAASINAVNGLVRDLLWPTAEMARVIEAVARGDLSQKMGISIDSRELCGDFLHVREVVNTMVDQLNSFASEVTRVAREMGTKGKLGAADLTRARRHGDRIRSCLAAIAHSRFWQKI